MLQIPSDIVTQVTEVKSTAMSMNFGTNVANKFP